jgi:hypothetical protein
MYVGVRFFFLAPLMGGLTEQLLRGAPSSQPVDGASSFKLLLRGIWPELYFTVRRR